MRGCKEDVVGRGLCRKHYMRLQRKGSTDDSRKNARGLCSVRGCKRLHRAGGLCESHYKSRRATARRRAEKLARPRLCAQCDKPVLGGYRGPVSYCSRVCKDKAYSTSERGAVSRRKSYFKRRYNLTIEQVEEMAAKGCAICGTTTWNGRHQRPHIDHDHETGRIRGLLCHSCNLLLGNARDDPSILRAAIRYLA